MAGYPRATVRLADGGGALDVRCLYTWNRGDIAEAISGSSGPKDYIKNQVFAVFEADPTIARIVMVRAGGPPFLLRRDRRGRWFDAAGKHLLVEPAL